MNIHEAIKQYFDPINKWYRSRLDQPPNGSQASLESIFGRYLIYCHMTKEYSNVGHILSTIEFFGGLIPRIIIRDGRTAQELDALERKKGLWISETDKDGKSVAIRYDSGCGQAPIACMGIAFHDPRGAEWAETIARHGYNVTYYGKPVPQGNLFSYFPLPTNNCLEALCLHEISSVRLPWKQTARTRIALDYAFPWDKPEHRSLLLWFLSICDPKYKKRFDAWIRTRDKDLPELEQKYNTVKDNVYDSDYLTGVLDWLLQNEIRK